MIKKNDLEPTVPLGIQKIEKHDVFLLKQKPYQPGGPCAELKKDTHTHTYIYIYMCM